MGILRYARDNMGHIYQILQQGVHCQGCCTDKPCMPAADLTRSDAAKRHAETYPLEYNNSSSDDRRNNVPDRKSRRSRSPLCASHPDWICDILPRVHPAVQTDY